MSSLASSLLVVVVCLAVVVLIQYLLCRSDNILLGLIVPVVLTIFGVVMATLTAGNSLNKAVEFLKWFIPAIVGYIIYFKTKKSKHNKKKAAKQAEKEKKLAEKAKEKEAKEENKSEVSE